MISVVMPAYNSERFISEAIKSILCQTFPEFELIIIDDGSTDRTLDIAHHYAEQDSRIKVIRSNHGGISNALNLGIEQSSHEWVVIMHADDIALPLRLERQLSAAEANPEVVAWGAYCYHMSEHGKILSLSKVGPTKQDEFLALRRSGDVILILHPTAFMHKAAVVKAGMYNPQFDGSEELELFDRLAEFGPILAIPEPLICYRVHASSVSMLRFFQMRTFTRYVRARQCARARGEKPPTWDKFIFEYTSAPICERLRRQLDDRSQFCYRKFGVAISSERYVQAFLFLSLSAMLNPKYAISRVWHQRFSETTRNLLKAPVPGADALRVGQHRIPEEKRHKGIVTDERKKTDL